MSAATELELESELNLESESEHELAQEIVGETELEHELEGEHEAFFNHLAAMADRGGRSQALRRVALAAARSALRSYRRPWPVVEGESELEAEAEAELEFESVHEGEFELSPAQESQIAAMMEHEGHAAAEAANEQEAAEHFLPLVGLAAKFVLPKLAGMAAKKLGGMAVKKLGGRLIGRVGGQLARRVAPRLIRRVTPQLTRGIANVTRTLFRNRSTRPLIHAMPRIARGTVARLGRQVAAGRRITPRYAVRTLARQTARTLSNPRILAQTYRRSLALDRRYHRHTRRVLGRPVGAPVRVVNDPGSPFATAIPGFSATPGIVSPLTPATVLGGMPGIVNAPGTCTCRCGQPAATATAPIFAPPVAAPAVCPTCGR